MMSPDKKPPPQRKAPQAKTKLPPFEEFLAEAELLKDKAMAVLREDGHHSPILMLFTEEGKEVAGLRVSGDRPLHEYVKAVVHARKARAFVCISEAWAVLGPDVPETLARGIRPSRHPERRQVLVVSAIHPEGKRMWFVPFASEGGKVVLGTPVDSASAGMTLAGGIPEALDREEG